MDIKEARRQIDEIDARIIELYNKRMEKVEEIASSQDGGSIRPLDQQRARAKLSLLRNSNPDTIIGRGAEEILEQIMALGRKRQYQLMAERETRIRLPFTEVESLARDNLRVVYQGDRGSYSDMAMRTFFGDDVDNFNVETFRDAMIAIEEGAADYAVLPIENSTAGVVSQIYDMLAEFENYIVGEQIIRVEHCLMACDEANENTIERVYSHAQSLMQCERFLAGFPHWEQISMQNNAFAAMKVAKEQDVTQAAIAGELAAQLYGLKILKKGINHDENNSTRFIIVTNQKVFVKNANRISICMEGAHESGSLYHLLSHIIYNGLNMTKIESRPIEERSWEYRFFIDFDGNLRDPGVRNALRGLRDDARFLRVLGNYRV